MKKKYQQHFLLGDFIVVTILMVIFIVFFESTSLGSHFEYQLNGFRKDFYVLAASIGATMLGFALTAISVILVWLPGSRFRIIREGGHGLTIFQIFSSSIKWLGFLTIVAIAGIFWDKDPSPVTDSSPTMFITYLTIWLAVIVIAKLCRCLWILKRMANIALQPSVS